MRRRFGDEAVDYLAEPLLAGIHAGDVERLSVRALFPRLVDAERQTGSVIRAFRALRVAPSPQGAFVSLPGGIGELVDALLRALAPATVTLSSRVTDLRRAGMYIAESVTGPVAAARRHPRRAGVYGAGRSCAGSTRRSRRCARRSRMRRPPPSPSAIGVNRFAHPMAGTGFVVPRVEHSALLAGTWVTSKWPGRAPDGHALLRGFLGGGRDPHRLEHTDDELIAVAREELETLLGISGAPLFARLSRWTRQSPQYEVGHLQRVARIEQRLAAVPGRLHDRQRLPRDRHPRLHHRRQRDGGTGHSVPEHTDTLIGWVWKQCTISPR